MNRIIRVSTSTVFSVNQDSVEMKSVVIFLRSHGFLTTDEEVVNQLKTGTIVFPVFFIELHHELLLLHELLRSQHFESPKFYDLSLSRVSGTGLDFYEVVFPEKGKSIGGKELVLHIPFNNIKAIYSTDWIGD